MSENQFSCPEGSVNQPNEILFDSFAQKVCNRFKFTINYDKLYSYFVIRNILSINLIKPVKKTCL